MPDILLNEIYARASSLFFALLLAIPLGGLLTLLLRTGPVVHTLSLLAANLGRRLNKRDAATRAWRGVIVTALIFIPALALGWWFGTLGFVLPLIVFSFALNAGAMLALWQQARRGKLHLSITRPYYLFPDTHALLRYRVLTHSRYFTIGVIGVAFWYMLAGGAGMLGYLALALAASEYATEHDQNRAFGGVARQLFSAVDAAPRVLSALLLTAAAIFVPGARPHAALRRLNAEWAQFLAYLLDISLGGPIPLARRHYQAPWVGDGTPKLEARHLTRWLLVWAVALLMLLVLVLPALMQLKTLK